MSLSGALNLAPARTRDRRLMLVAAIVLVAIWARAVFVTWQQFGLFNVLGADYGPIFAAASLVRDGHAAGMYDPATALRAAQPLVAFQKITAENGDMGPVLYPPVFFLFVAPLTLLPPGLSLFAWM